MDQSLGRARFSAMPELPVRRSSSARTSASGTFETASTVVALRHDRVALAAKRGDHRLDRLLAELLGRLFHPAANEFGGPGFRVARGCPFGDDPLEIGEVEARFHGRAL
jgi:hypothetical protein